MKTTPHLYRDCLRLIQHIAGNSPKGLKMKAIVSNEFRKNKNVKDPQQIETLKFNAVRAFSNFLIYDSMCKDPKMKKRVADWAESQIGKKQ